MCNTDLIRSIAALAALLAAIAFGAPPAAGAELSIADGAGIAGREVSLFVSIDDAADLLSADLAMSFDPGVVAPVAVRTTALSGGFLAAHTVTWGTVAVALAGSEALGPGSGEMLEIVFKIQQNAASGQTRIGLSKAIVYGADYQASDLLAPGTTGVLQIQGIDPGDLDGSGQIDLIDIILALQVLAGQNVLDALPPTSDVNADGIVGFEEAVLAAQRVAGLRSPLPASQTALSQ